MFLEKMQREIGLKSTPTLKSLLRWAKRNLIHPFYNKQAFKWIWVPKTNSI